MRTRLFEGSIRHTRFQPTLHRFDYSYPMTLVDLDEARELEHGSFLFGWNRRRFFSLLEGSYFLPGVSSLKDRVLDFLDSEGISREVVDRISLLTVPSFFGWGFNPVSFYLCQASDGSIPVLLAEVNNTFRERHLYLLENGESPPTPNRFRSAAEKVFHVSPFFDCKGGYEFDFQLEEERLSARIDYHREGSKSLSATLEGSLVPWSRAGLRRSALRHPIVRLLTTARIHIQAARLFFARKLPYHPKPEPGSRFTRPLPRTGWFDRKFRSLLSRCLQNLGKGRLRLEHPDGSMEEFGAPGDEAPLSIRVQNPRFYRSTLLGGDVGFGESYMREDWNAEDLPGLIRLLIRNRESMGNYNFPYQRLLKGLAWCGIGSGSHSRGRSRRDIAAHYDLSNEFFEQFLDPTLTYSCAYFSDPETPLLAAQEAKIDRIVEKAGIRPTDAVLEIGSGWGALAKRLAERKGCEVTSVTLSRRQFEYARRLMEASRLDRRVRIEYRDYRDIAGSYDRIVSIEMLEAVGWKNLPVFFRTCQRLLKREGRAVLQVITIPERHFEAYRHGRDFIRTHIFPGGFLPSVQALEEVIRRHTDFSIGHLENIGPHYGTTIREWRSRFLANRDRILELGFDETFIRKWLYYFAYCEAAFDTRTLGVHQIVLEKRA